MKYLVIDPFIRGSKIVIAKSTAEALALAGLDGNDTDHGVVGRYFDRGLGIFVGGHSMFEPVNEQKYFAIGGRLYAGRGLVYAFDGQGRTIEFARPIPMVRFFEDALEIEYAIHQHEIMRPQIVINGKVTWSWPAAFK